MRNNTVSVSTDKILVTTTTMISTSTSAVKRLEQYFKDHEDEIISIDVLQAVAGIRDWTRAIRFVRSDYKMKIEYVPEGFGKQAGYIYRHRLI